MGRQIIYTLEPGDLVRIMPTDDVMQSCPDCARCIGIVIELRPDEFYEGHKRSDGGTWQAARIFVPGRKNGKQQVSWWSLNVWGEDLELLQEAE
jgi:hypothetical protein